MTERNPIPPPMTDLELVARYITAKKMGLVKDVYGHRLPAELWGRYEDQARRLLEVYPKDEVMNVIDLTIGVTHDF